VRTLQRVDVAERWQNLLKAIGGISQASASVSIFLQQLSEVITGSEAHFAGLIDEPLGRQIIQVRALPRASFDPELSGLATAFLLDLENLLRYRNRLAHDQWTVVMDMQGFEDSIYGHRPWGTGKRPSIYSTTTTVCEITGLFTTLSSGINSIAIAAGAPMLGRPQDLVARRASAIEVSKYLNHFRPCLRQGRPLPDWQWHIVPPDTPPPVKLIRPMQP